MSRRLVILFLIGATTLTVVPLASAPGQLGARPPEDWIARLERPDRVAGLKIPEVIQQLGIKPGDVVADIGAGAGVFSWPLARAVSPGTMYAVEVDKGFIDYLQRRAAAEQLTNVRPVLGKFDDPLLPERVDLAFFHDVLHHVEKKAEYVAKVATYVKPGGRIAIIELDATRPDASHKDDPNQQVMKPDLDRWMTAAGLRKLQEIAMFDDKWFVIYQKAPEKQ